MKRLLALMLVFAATPPLAAAQSRAEPRLAGGPERVCAEDEIRQALAGSYAGPPCRFTDMPAGLDAAPQRPVSQPAAVQHAIMSSRHEGNAFTASQQSAAYRTQTASRPPHRPEPHGETIRLSDDFFSGGLVGGVERPFVPLYSYRGLILIAADGQVRTGHAGLGHRVLQVRAMDNQTAPLTHDTRRRAYPYR